MRKTKRMILDKHPDVPGASYGNVKFIGYWLPSKKVLQMMYDDGRSEDTIDRFMSLPHPANFVDDNWNDIEKEKVIQYLKSGKEVEWWRGCSYCRFGCGSLEGSTDKSDGKWVWPEAFFHYIEKHNVKPPVEFLKDVLFIASVGM